MDSKIVFIAVVCLSVMICLCGVYYDNIHGNTSFHGTYKVPQPIFRPLLPGRGEVPSPPLITDHKKSAVTIPGKKEYYEISDNVAIMIEARDKTGMVKSHGGDYFRTKLYTSTPYSAVGPDSFFDFDNGTYLAHFTLRWSGTVRVWVQLVHPSEAVRVFRHNDKRVLNFTGGFTNVVDGKEYVENVTCGIAPFQPPTCNLNAKHTHGPWFCKKPTNGKLTCGDWTYSYMATGQEAGKLGDSLTEAEMETFKRTKVPLDTKALSFNVRPSNMSTSRPLCSYTSTHVPPDIATRGFFLEDNWQPYDCDVRSFNKIQIGSCLSRKSMHFYGDSTARQMYTYLTDRMGCPKIYHADHGSRLVGNDCEIYFKFHGLPVRGKTVILVKELRYVAEEIDRLKGGPGEVIVLSVWAHFGLSDGLNGTFYRDRLLAIRGAVERLWERSPETRVIVRSANTRGHVIGGFILISSDWIALQGEGTLREVFSSDKRFGFLDVWDMSLVQKSGDTLHPTAPTLIPLMNYLLTMICSPQTTGNS